MLKNMAERKAFVNDYRNWGMYVEVPELSMRVYRKKLPDGTTIYATEIKEPTSYPAKEYDWGYPHYQLVQKGGYYKLSSDSMSTIIEHMMRIKVDVHNKQ